MSIPGWLKRKGPTGFGYRSTAEQVTEGLDLSGRSVLVTGCNSGLGLETVRVLALRGARIIGAARTREKALAALEALPGEHLAVACELSEPASARAAVRTVLDDGAPLSAVICNAGIMALPELRQAHGYELQFFTNHVGHFILVTGLLSALAADGRVVVLSSAAHVAAPPEGIQFDNLSGESGYKPWVAYGQSKLANLLFARSLAGRLPPGQTANAVHPGVIATNLGRHMGTLARSALRAAAPLVLKSPGQGAATQCYVAVHPGAAGISGEYWADCNIARSSALGRDSALAERLWVETERIVAAL